MAAFARKYPEMAADHDRSVCDDFTCEAMGLAIKSAKTFLKYPLTWRNMMKFWIRIDPSGCVKGSVLYSTYLREDLAHKHFTPDFHERSREKAAGWRHELVDAAEWTRRAQDCMKGLCTHKAPDVSSCPACGHLLSSHDDGQPCGERWDVCEDPDCSEPRRSRELRRESLLILLSRMERGVLLPEERRLLRASVMAEITDVERAYALAARMRTLR